MPSSSLNCLTVLDFCFLFDFKSTISSSLASVMDTLSSFIKEEHLLHQQQDMMPLFGSFFKNKLVLFIQFDHQSVDFVTNRSIQHRPSRLWRQRDASLASSREQSLTSASQSPPPSEQPEETFGKLVGFGFRRFRSQRRQRRQQQQSPTERRDAFEQQTAETSSATAHQIRRH